MNKQPPKGEKLYAAVVVVSDISFSSTGHDEDKFSEWFIKLAQEYGRSPYSLLNMLEAMPLKKIGFIWDEERAGGYLGGIVEFTNYWYEGYCGQEFYVEEIEIMKSKLQDMINKTGLISQIHTKVCILER